VQRRRTSEIKKAVSLASMPLGGSAPESWLKLTVPGELPPCHRESSVDDAVHVQGSRDEGRRSRAEFHPGTRATPPLSSWVEHA
jgi:hypothetical protein